MAMRMLASTVRRISKPDCRIGTVASRAIIANIRPHSPLLGSTLTWRQHRNWCVISVQFAEHLVRIAQLFAREAYE
jgi:hypothetical protein